MKSTELSLQVKQDIISLFEKSKQTHQRDNKNNRYVQINSLVHSEKE